MFILCILHVHSVIILCKNIFFDIGFLEFYFIDTYHKVLFVFENFPKKRKYSNENATGFSINNESSKCYTYNTQYLPNSCCAYES